MIKKEPDQEKGLYPKYRIYKGESKEQISESCFVLRPESDIHARTALQVYANSCEVDYPNLAKDLREWVNKAYHD